jgi:hypothetical protein
MKKLIKLQINPENLLKGEDLIVFRGGILSSWHCYVGCIDYSGYIDFASSCEIPDCADDQCSTFYNQQFRNCLCLCSQNY